MRADSAGSWSYRVGGALATTAATLALVACGGGGGSGASTANAAFLSEVHLDAPDVGSYRSDVQLTRLGRAACDGFRAGASFQQLADRLVLLEGNNPLPSADLGTVLNSAVAAYCPQFRSRVG